MSRSLASSVLKAEAEAAPESLCCGSRDRPGNDKATVVEKGEHQAIDLTASHRSAVAKHISRPASPVIAKSSSCHGSAQIDETTNNNKTTSSQREHELELEDGSFIGAEGHDNLSFGSSLSVTTADLVSEMQNGTLLSDLTHIYESYFPPGQAPSLESQSTSSGSSSGVLSYELPNERGLATQTAKNESDLGLQTLNSSILKRGQDHRKENKKTSETQYNNSPCPKTHDQVNGPFIESDIADSADGILDWVNNLPDCAVSDLPLPAATPTPKTPARRLHQKPKMSNLRLSMQ